MIWLLSNFVRKPDSEIVNQLSELEEMRTVLQLLFIVLGAYDTLMPQS